MADLQPLIPFDTKATKNEVKKAQQASPLLNSDEHKAGQKNIDGKVIAPPASVANPRDFLPSNSQPSTNNVPTSVTDEQARRALLNLAGQEFCWGKKAAQRMEINSIVSTSVFHYTLDTFTEERKTARCHVPYNGEQIDGPFNGPSPSPWSIPMNPNSMFANHEKHCEVPHTATVEVCTGCTGKGTCVCQSCHGSGHCCCNECNGSGHKVEYDEENHHHHVRCHACSGTGSKLCTRCAGSGNIICSVCNGKGRLKYFTKLTVTWQTHTVDHIAENTALPDDLIRQARGEIAFEHSAPRVAPVNHFQDNRINTASATLVQRHANSFPNKRIVMQRHMVRIIPVSEVQAEYKQTHFAFCVYGNNNTAYAPDYPQKMCCGCTIL